MDGIQRAEEETQKFVGVSHDLWIDAQFQPRDVQERWSWCLQPHSECEETALGIQRVGQAAVQQAVTSDHRISPSPSTHPAVKSWSDEGVEV